MMSNSIDSENTEFEDSRKKVNQEQDDPETESSEEKQEKTIAQSFLAHLEEFRWTLIYSAGGLLLGVIISFIFIDYIFEYFLLQPLKQFDEPIYLQNLKPFGQVVLYIQVSFFSGLILSLPWIVYQFWKFIYPALYEKEISYLKSIVVFTTACFLLGIAFAYYIVIPYSMNFFLNFGSDLIQNNIAANEYLTFIIQIMVASGLLFELPMLSYFLSKIGLLTPAFMRHYRKVAYFIVLVIAGIVTPPDVISQIMLLIPMAILYEISIFISAHVQKNKKAKSN